MIFHHKRDIHKIIENKKYVCSICGAKFKEGQKFCPKCGSFLEMTFNHNNNNNTDYVKLGMDLKNKGDHKGAIEAFDKAIHFNQRKYDALYGKGECLLKLKDYHTALSCFQDAIQYDNINNSRAYHGAGRAYHFLKKYDDALECYDKSIRLDKHDIVAWLWKGRTLIELGKYDEAEKSLHKALDNAIARGTEFSRIMIKVINEDLEKVNLKFGWDLKNKGDFKGAMKAFEKVIEKNQYKVYDALHGKGECLLELKDYDAALKCFQAAIDKDKNHPWAYHGAGRAYHFLKKYDNALSHYEKSIDLESGGIVAWQWKGRTLIELGKYEEAEEALKKALDNSVGKSTEFRTNINREINNDLEKLHKKIDTDKKKKQQEPIANVIIQGNNVAPIAIGGGVIAQDDGIILQKNKEKDNNNANHETKYEIKETENVTQEKPRILEVEVGFGAKLLGTKKYVCSKCGKEVRKDQIYCNNCGSEFR